MTPAGFVLVFETPLTCCSGSPFLFSCEKNLPLVTQPTVPPWCFVFPDAFGFCLNVLVNTFQGLNSVLS